MKGSNLTPPLANPRNQPRRQVSEFSNSEGTSVGRGWAPRAWLSKAPLSPADGPYLVIVEQPKQVS